MLVPSANIWDTRLQTVGALVTAVASGRREVYYLATACQVGIHPPLISISPNPEYPICDAIRESGRFGIHFLGADQEAIAQACIALNRHVPDKIAALGVPCETTVHGTPMLLDCVQSIECRVWDAWDSGDHRTIIGEIEERRIRSEGRRPQRYFSSPSPVRRFLKAALVRTHLYDAFVLLGRVLRPIPDIHQGTRRHLPRNGS